MNWLDYVVLLGALLGIAAYGIWRTRGRRDLNLYLKGAGDTNWLVVGLSVMATQASAITFLSTPGQGYEDGLGFVQNYFGAPFALIIISVFFLPIYRRLKVYTAYEFLGQRFDTKTRLLGAALFLLQRGLGAGFTIYAPAIVLSTVMGWRLDVTIIGSGLVVIAYTVAGGSDAVTHTQKYQLGIIFAGMTAAFIILLIKLQRHVPLSDAFTIAGGFHKLDAVDFSLSGKQRYTFWSGLLGGLFLALSYFGTDQSQVQRYISGGSLRESRLGLMFNAIFKIPLQFFILLLGSLLFVFYQFQQPPVFFNETAWKVAVHQERGTQLKALERQFTDASTEKRVAIERWLTAKHSGNAVGEAAARKEALSDNDKIKRVRDQATESLKAANGNTTGNDADYVFITFILRELPHGLIGLLVAAFFAAALASKAAELNALGSTTTVDIYRHIVKRTASDAHYVTASKCFTVFWGLVAISFALFANLVENLIQAVNILGSIFYGVVLGIFLVAFFIQRIGGTAMFWGAIAAQLLVFVLYAELDISYLWFNVIGCAICILFALLLQAALPRSPGDAVEIPAS
ncbi:MAG: sodium:solute symporter [Armatimonadota bacterium]|nr:sodium:solute symporter [Armatimonadota bacterium]